MLLLATVGLVLAAGPAAADAAKPGDYTSEVTSIDPDPGGFDIEVTGGDAFLHLTVDDGHEVIVEGYEGEPYLRFDDDGTVEENRRSPATYINRSRYGTNADVPSDLAVDDVASLDPDWQEVASDGEYVWHDHRTHLMTPDPPVGRGESFDWLGPVPLTVDGTAVEVNGQITYHDDVSPLPWYALAAVLVVGIAVWGTRLPGRALALAMVAAGLLATVVAWIDYTSLPSAAGPSFVPIVVGGIATVAAVGALVARDRLATILLLVAGAFLATWGVFRLSVLSNPVLPTDAPFALERLTTSLAIGLGVGAVVLAFRAVAQLSALALDDEDQPPT